MRGEAYAWECGACAWNANKHEWAVNVTGLYILVL